MPDQPHLPYFRSTGLGVSDLARSVDFYTRVMGMEQVQTFELDYMDEVIVSFPNGEGGHGHRLVLMHWKDGSERNYQGNPVKIVWQVADAKATAERARAAGFKVTREPGLSKAPGSKNVIGFIEDPDGYQIELMQLG